MTHAATQAQQLLRAGRPEDAEQVLRRQLELTPADANLRTLLAQLLARIGRKSDAIVELQRAVEREQVAGVRPAHLLLARLANELGRPALAEQHARLLTDADPGDSEAWSALGFAAFAQGQRRAALAALRQA